MCLCNIILCANINILKEHLIQNMLRLKKDSMHNYPNVMAFGIKNMKYFLFNFQQNSTY